MQAKTNSGWKYKAGRRRVPEASKHDLRVYMYALLEEANGECDRLRPKLNGPTDDVSRPLYEYWNAVRKFLAGRIASGITAISDSRYHRAEVAATFEQPALLTAS